MAKHSPWPATSRFSFWRCLRVRNFGGSNATGRSPSSRTERDWLWEVATGKERRRLEGHDSAVTSAAFAQDGRTLLTGSEKGSVLVWDVARWGMSRSGELSSKDVQPLWQDLAGDDAVRAGRAIGALAATPGQTLPLLRRHVQPVAAADPRRLNQLVAQLDSERFPVRDSAGRQLEELGELAGPILRETLARKSSLELRQRVEGLLRKLDGPMLASDGLRDLRAVETLERIGTAEARQVLERIAKGTPEARVTREAKASVERLVKRPAAWP